MPERRRDLSAIPEGGAYNPDVLRQHFQEGKPLGLTGTDVGLPPWFRRILLGVAVVALIWGFLNK